MNRTYLLVMLFSSFPALTGCDKLMKQVIKSPLNGHSSAANGLLRHDDIKIVLWGQSNAQPELGHMLGARITTGDVLLYDFHKGSTDSYYWKDPVNHQALVDAVALQQPDYVFCLQGESDANTPATIYYQNMAVVWEKIKLASPHSYRSQAMLGSYTAVGDARAGQWMLKQAGLIFMGPDVEKFRNDTLTIDGVHFNPEGQRQIADKWLSIMNGENYRYWDANNDRYFN